MPNYIVKCRGHYAEWSTVVDAPVTRFMTLDQFAAYYRTEYGERGMDDLPARLDRADGPNACSAYTGESWASMVAFNRCGPRETRLTEDEIWAKYGPDAPEEPA